MHFPRSLTIAAAVAVSLGGFAIMPAHATLIGGVEFPGGSASFADAVVGYSVGSGGVTSTFEDPSQALGAPDYSSSANNGFVSLGEGGTITLKFTNNLLTGSGNSNDDLWIFEIGTAVEATFVEISKDGAIWLSVGEVAGATRGVDLDSFGYGTSDQFAYVRLTDDRNDTHGAGSTAGADIDAVGAISTVPTRAVPEPGVLTIFASALIGFGVMRRNRLIARPPRG